MTAQAISRQKLGLALGAFIGGWHAIWSALVLVGCAQAVINFMFWLHFLAPPYQVGSFVLWRAAALIAFTAGIGYCAGWVIGTVWNRVHIPTSP
jgi:hypothetical protein